MKQLCLKFFSVFRFHVVASKGNLDCLNTILIHGVDITATDAAGMLHLVKCSGATCRSSQLTFHFGLGLS